MANRKLETSLARFTLGALVIYAPLEVWTSLPDGLGHPMFLVDVVGMALMFFGARCSLRARPKPAVGILAAAWAWTAANGWRATSWRWLETREGGELDHGQWELWATAIGTLGALICLALCLVLSYRTVFSSADNE